MGTASSTRGQSIAVRPVQSATINDKGVKQQLSSTSIIPPKQPENHTIYSVYIVSKSADKSVSEEPEENDDTVTKSEEKTKTVLTEEDIEVLKTQAFKSVENNLAILSDIEGHLRENGLFNQDFHRAAFDLRNAYLALEKASFEVNKKFSEELGDVIVELGGVKTICDVAVLCQKIDYHIDKGELFQDIWIDCNLMLSNFTDSSPKYAPLLAEHDKFLSSVSEALQHMQTKHLVNIRVGNNVNNHTEYKEIVKLNDFFSALFVSNFNSLKLSITDNLSLMIHFQFC